MPHPSLEVTTDIDARLADVMAAAMAVEVLDWEALVVLLRLAYAAGHRDALTDPKPERLYVEHGYTAPRRSTRKGDCI